MGWSKKNGVWNLHREPWCLYAFDADPGNYVRNGSGVSRWDDLTGHGCHTLQSTALNQPIWVERDSDFGGHGSIDFSGGKILSSGIFSIAPGQQYDLYFVLKCYGSAGAGKQQCIYDGINGTVQRAVCYNNGADLNFIAATDFSVGVATGVIPSAMGKSIFGVSYNAASCSIYRNNATTPIAAGTLNTNRPNGITLGNMTGSTALPFNGKMAYVLGVQRNLTDAERTRLFGFWKAKYGI